METNFLTLYLRMFFKPRNSFEILFESKKILKFSFIAFLIPAVGYTLFYIMASRAGGSPSTFKPWLALPIEDYFRYDIILTIPGYYLSWIAASATIYLLSGLSKSSIRFDHMLAVIAFGFGVATWSTLLHELTDALLSITGIIEMQEYEKLLNEPTFWRGMMLSLFAIYFVWHLCLFTIGIRVANGFSILKSLLIALAGLACFQVILLIFIR